MPIKTHNHIYTVTASTCHFVLKHARFNSNNVLFKQNRSYLLEIAILSQFINMTVTSVSHNQSAGSILSQSAARRMVNFADPNN